MKANKRILSLILATTLLSTTLVGCGNLDSTATILTIGGEEVSAGVANFYARYEQSLYETYYSVYLGSDMWKTEVMEGETYEETVKATLMNTLQELYVIRQHAEELEINLSTEELEEINSVADKFMEANTDVEVNELASVNRDNVVEILSLLTLKDKAKDVIIADVDTDVSNEDTIQKKMTVVNYDFSYTNEDGEYVTVSDEEKEKMYSNLEGLKLATSGDLLSNGEAISAPVQEMTFDANTNTLDISIIAAADELALNEFSEVIETTNGYSLVQLTSLNDKEATATVVENIIYGRESELYNTTIEAWIAEADAKVVTSVWNKVNFVTLGVNVPSIDENGITTIESTYEYGERSDSEATEE